MPIAGPSAQRAFVYRRSSLNPKAYSVPSCMPT